MKPHKQYSTIREWVDAHFPVLFFLVLGAIMFIALALSGCDIQKHLDNSAKRKTVKAYSKSPSVVAGLMGQWFPPVTQHDSTYIQGETIYRTDTLNHIDTVENGSIQYINRYLDVYHTRVDTFRQRVVEVNNAALFAANDSNKRLQAVIAQKDITIALKDRKAANWQKIAITGWSIILLFLLLKYLKKATNLLRWLPI